jgi:tRNA/rRNA methyltransferase
VPGFTSLLHSLCDIMLGLTGYAFSFASYYTHRPLFCFGAQVSNKVVLMMPFSDTFHIVLVSPQESLNVGSVLRAMLNLEYKYLHLVAPRDFDPHRARITACHAESLIPSIQIHKTLSDALAPMQNVVGFSAQTGRNRLSIESLPQWARSQRFTVAKQIKTALVFGPEDTGLFLEDLDLCRTLIAIPSGAEYSSFNLAQAVLLALYSIRESVLDADVGDSVPSEHGSEEAGQGGLASWRDFQYLDSLVDSVLELSRFYRKGTPQPIPGVVKRLLRRTEPSDREMGIMLGMFRRIEGVLSGRVPVGERVSKKVR